MTDRIGRVYEHLQYTPWGETWVEQRRGKDLFPKYQFTGKELDPETNLYYFGARYYDPQTSVWVSVDPIINIYLDGKIRTGVYNSFNIGLYMYASNNPIVYIDPSGLTTEINETTNEVMNVIKNNDTSILAYPYVDGKKAVGPPNRIGESLEVNSFISPDTKKTAGKLYPGQSIDNYIDKKVVKAGEYGKEKTFKNSIPGKEFDIKSQYPGHELKSYHGLLFRGKYVTLREAGNILAGMNAAQFGMPFEDFQKGAGALEAGGVFGVFLHRYFGKTYGTAPMWGEKKYQYSRSKYGYSLFLQERAGQ